jgi:hypothetical protein
MKTVMIGTPAIDGKVDCRYVDSLMGTLRIAGPEFAIYPVFMPGDALVQRARNAIVKLALEAFDGKGVDDLVMIDADMAWNPGDFMKLLSHDVDIVGGLCCQKSDEQVVTVRLHANSKADERNLLEVDGIGCGFTRYSRLALQRLWKASPTYTQGGKEVVGRSVFSVDIIRGELFGEDISVCNKWRHMRGRIFADISIHVAHIGTKVYVIQGDDSKAKATEQ